MKKEKTVHKMIKFVSFSDTHGKHRNLTEHFKNRKGDILLFAGDLQRNDYDYGVDFLAWISSLPYTHKVITFGNHDTNYSAIIDEAYHYPSVKIVVNETVRVMGLNIFCSPYSLNYGDYVFMTTEGRLALIYNTIPDNTDILVTHTPATGILDETIRKNRAGSTSLYEKIISLPNLKFHLAGHIHEARGRKKVGNTRCMNVSCLDLFTKEINPPMFFNYKEK